MSIFYCPNLKNSSTGEMCCNHLTGTEAQSIPNDASREQPAPPVVSSTTTGNAGSSNSKLKREPKVASWLWKLLFNDLKLAARNFSAASLLGEGGFGCVRGFTNDTSREQPDPAGVLFTPTGTAIDSSVSSTTTSNTAITTSISSKITSNATINSLTSKVIEENIVAPQLQKFSLKGLKLATRKFSLEGLLGKGGFGCVFKGWVEENWNASARPGTGLTVAIKVLNTRGIRVTKNGW
ncbi:probable serine/threonine-protein kinase PIX7 [Eucalyptus grandis]|uniref:probable serine/threonine-protein kinase PIX7 n=1 Tax=Eucalyptus grandis TaxID=71139 RepID=UPI00192EC79F|nr:probable serine/threonine-protein kinase PIX7 [Eucalyptus grandis]